MIKWNCSESSILVKPLKKCSNSWSPAHLLTNTCSFGIVKQSSGIFRLDRIWIFLDNYIQLSETILYTTLLDYRKQLNYHLLDHYIRPF